VEIISRGIAKKHFLILALFCRNFGQEQKYYQSHGCANPLEYAGKTVDGGLSPSPSPNLTRCPPLPAKKSHLYRNALLVLYR
ncbi:unnamed protein product, partial [Amoebophrya sp. A25]